MSYAQMELSRDVSYEPVSNEMTANLKTTRVIFFAGDAIPPHEKHEMPDIKGFGGIYLPHVRTLPQGSNHGSRGMVYQCKLTPLKTTRRSEWKNMLPPDARQHWDSSFVGTAVVDGRTVRKTVHGFQGSNLLDAKKGVLTPEMSDHIVHKERFPGNDVRMATQRSVPNGVGGVVEVSALLGATDDEIEAAQLFFFPEWHVIAQGLKSLPTTIDDVEAHIKARMAAIPVELDAMQQGKYILIGNDMLRSCTEFRRTGGQIIEKDDTALKAAAADNTQAHSPVSTHLLDQLKIKRKGDLLAGDHSAINRLAEVMEKKETAVDSARALLLEERKQYTAEIAANLRERDFDEEVRLGMRKAEVSPITDSDGDGIPDYRDAEPTVHNDPQVDVAEVLATEPTIIAMHSNVTVDGRTGVVTGKPGGRITVKFDDDGTSKTVAKEEVTV